jgi:hypothetical protein
MLFHHIHAEICQLDNPKRCSYSKHASTIQNVLTATLKLFTAISKENSLAFCIGNLPTINMFIRECQCDCRAKIQQKQQCD